MGFIVAVHGGATTSLYADGGIEAQGAFLACGAYATGCVAKHVSGAGFVKGEIKGRQK